MSTNAIVIVLEQGCFIGAYTAEGQPIDRPIVLIDYDVVSDFDETDPDSILNKANSLYLVPQTYGDPMPALVQEVSQDGWLTPTMAEFVATFVEGDE